MSDGPRFHFFTLLTKDDQYAEMRASLATAGFDDSNAIFTVLDNRQTNAHEPYSAITEAVRTARAPYIVFCHQDLVFYQGPDALLGAIAEVQARDPDWAVLGNAGFTPGLDASVFLDDHAGAHRVGVVPARVLSLDENFLLIRRDASVGCSPELSGFHLYGTDLCLNAYALGFSAWTLDYSLMHKGSSLDGTALHRLAPAFRRAWRGRLRGGVVVTPCVVMIFSRVPLLFEAANRPAAHARIMKRFRLVRTLDYLLRHGRPDWLPMARYVEGDWRGPSLSPAVRRLDALLRRGGPGWRPTARYEDVELWREEPSSDAEDR